MLRKMLFCMAFFGLLANAGSVLAQAPRQALDGIVAIVEEEVILRSELDGAIAGILRQYQGREQQLPPQNVLERQVLERLTMIKLQVQRAKDTGIKVTDTEVDEAITGIARNNNLTLPQLQEQLQRDGYSVAEFRETMRDELLVQRLRQRVVESRSDVSESEVDLALASGAIRKGEVKLSHILVAIPDGADAEQISRAQTKIDGVKKLIDEGQMDFSAAAIRYSDSPQALDGGDLGWRRWDQIPPAFVDVISDLQVGQMTPQALRTASGYHLIKVTDRRESSQIVITEYKARRIVVKVTELVGEADARAAAENIHRRLKNGEDFAKLARELSEDDNTAPLGGELGWFQLEATSPEYAERISQLEDDGISDPFRDSQGWVIVQRQGKREQDRTELFVRNQVRDGLRQRKGEEAYENFLRQLKGESYVEYRIGNDAPASS